MSIMRKFRCGTIVGAALFSAATIGAMMGCGGGSPLGGGSTNNDQGTSLLAYGYFVNINGNIRGVSGWDTLLATSSNTGAVPDTTIGDGRQTVFLMGIQNRLSSQFVRITRIDCDYTVPGADPGFSVPSDSYPVGAVISAAGVIAEGPGQPQVPGDGATANGGGVSFARLSFNMVSTDIFSYLNVNRNSLPELPFRLYAECYAVGVTQAGDVMKTNSLPFTINLYDATECETGANEEICGDQGGFQLTGEVGGIPLTFNPDPFATPTPVAASEEFALGTADTQLDQGFGGSSAG